jgi:hypothetical protein
MTGYDLCVHTCTRTNTRMRKQHMRIFVMVHGCNTCALYHDHALTSGTLLVLPSFRIRISQVVLSIIGVFFVMIRVVYKKRKEYMNHGYLPNHKV